MYEKGAPVSYAEPPQISADFPNYRWRKLLAVIRRRGAAFRPWVASYLCRRWNATHAGDQRLVDIELVYMKRRTLPDYEIGPVERVSMHRQACK